GDTRREGAVHRLSRAGQRGRLGSPPLSFESAPIAADQDASREHPRHQNLEKIGGSRLRKPGTNEQVTDVSAVVAKPMSREGVVVGPQHLQGGNSSDEETSWTHQLDARPQKLLRAHEVLHDVK